MPKEVSKPGPPKVPPSTAAQGFRRWSGLGAAEAVVVVVCLVLYLLVLADIAFGGLVTHADRGVVDRVAETAGEPTWAVALADIGGLGVCGTVVVIVTLVTAQRLWRWWPLVLTALNLTAVGVLVAVTKAVVGRDGPPMALTEAGYPGYFPSGHTAAAVVCLGTTAFLLAAPHRRRTPRRADLADGRDDHQGLGRAERLGLAIGVGSGLVIGFGAVVSGTHWPSDVLASLLLGTAVLVTGFALVGRAAFGPRPAA